MRLVELQVQKELSGTSLTLFLLQVLEQRDFLPFFLSFFLSIIICQSLPTLKAKHKKEEKLEGKNTRKQIHSYLTVAILCCREQILIDVPIFH